MGVFTNSKDEEEALRNAAQAQSAATNSSSYANSRNTSTNNVSTTDYESAYSQYPSELESEYNNNNNNNTNINSSNSINGSSRSQRSSSTSTVPVQKSTRHETTPPAQTSLSAGSDSDTPTPDVGYTSQQQTLRADGGRGHDVGGDDDGGSDEEEKDFRVDDDPVLLARTITSKSIAHSHKSFTDEGIYADPVPEHRDFTRTQSEEYNQALQRTLSRQSLTKEKIIKENEEEQQKLYKQLSGGNKIPSEPEEVDPKTLDWDGPDDKDNPQNWSNARKWTYTMITASICLEVTFGSSLFVCGIPDIMLKMGVSQELSISGLTFYLLGLAFGPALSAPISELFGRRIVYVSSLPISMLFTMGVGLSNKIRSVLVLRFFAGFFASPAMAVAGGTIADLWGYEMIGIAMSGFCLAPFMGPVLGPIIGGFVEESENWKWTMWIILMFAGGILVPVLLTPETYKPVLLKRRAKKRGIKLKKPDLTGMQFIKLIFTVTLMTPVKMLFVEPIVMVFSIYTAFVFAVLFGFFEAYPIIFREKVYGMSSGISGLAFLGIGVGLVLGAAFYIAIDRFVFFKRNPDGTRGKRNPDGSYVINPESRLLVCKVGAICMPAALFWLGWSSRPSVHWICPIIAGAPFGFGLILIFFSVIMYFSMAYPPLSLASAIAANNLFRYILASVFPLFTVQMYDRLGIDWASSLFAFIAVAMVPLPWIFERWGPKLRSKSTYSYEAVMKRQREENARLQAVQSEAEQEILKKSGVAHSTSDSSDDNIKDDNYTKV